MRRSCGGQREEELGSAMELRIGNLYETVYRVKPTLARLVELSAEEVVICYQASWSQQGYWRLLSKPKMCRLAGSVFLDRLARAQSLQRRRLAEPPIEVEGIYEVRIKEEIYLVRIARAQEQEVTLVQVCQGRNDGSYSRLPHRLTVLPIELFRGLQRSAYEWRRA